MKKLIIVFYTLICLLVFLGSPFITSSQTLREPSEWTIMVYLDGDNNLEHAALMDMLEMEQAIPEGVEIIVLLDRHKGYSKALGDFSGTRLYRIRKAPSFALKQAALGLNVPLPLNFSSQLLEDWGECDMADPKTLTRFIERVAKEFPAKRYALIPWDHGSGASANGLLSDEDGGKGIKGLGSMSLKDFAKAVKSGAQYLPNKRFDLLKFELCLMGQLDVMAECASLADYAMASPPVEPSQGSDYLSILPFFKREVSTPDLIKKMVDLNIAYYNEIGREAAFSGFNLGEMSLVSAKLKNLMDHLTKIAPTYYKELTRATCFATHYENILEDLAWGDKAVSSLEVLDWLERIEKEVPEIPKDLLLELRTSLANLVFYTKATDNLKECRGVTLYLPLRRSYEHQGYKHLTLAQEAKILNYLQTLYKAQETLGDNRPKISNIEVGAPRIIKGHDGTDPKHFVIEKLPYLTPLSRNVVRFEVTGSGILLTKLLQFEQWGDKRHLLFEQLVINPEPKVSSKSSHFEEFSPHYNEGTTTIMREVGCCYKVSNGKDTYPITIANVQSTSSFAKNVSIGYGLYRDGTTGGEELLVQVQFSNPLRIPLKMIAYKLNDKGEMINMREMLPRNDGFFRPAITVLDNKLKASKVFGPAMPLNTGNFLLVLDMLQEGVKTGTMVLAETMNGMRAVGLSATYPVRHDPKQIELKKRAQLKGEVNLAGEYAMIEFVSTAKDPLMILPTFQTLKLIPNLPFMRFQVFNDGTFRGQGLVNWISSGIPQISLHKEPEMPMLPLGRTVQDWFAFLEGEGINRTWYVIGIGDGTRWALVPLERYKEEALQGVWESKTERYEFRGNQVRFSREGKSVTDTYALKGHILEAPKLPWKRYAVYVDRKHGRLTLISKEAVASILTLKEKRNETAKPNLTGLWLGGRDLGFAKVEIKAIANTPYYHLILEREGQSPEICTVAIKEEELWATYKDGTRLKIGFKIRGEQLELTFPHAPSLLFKRKL